MVFECVTTLPADEVFARAKRFFAERVPHSAAFPEREGPAFLVLRGQGGEEVALATFERNGSTSVRGSTLLFDQAVDRFFSTLPRAGHGTVNGEIEVHVRVLEAWDTIAMRLAGSTPIADVKRRALDAVRVTAPPADFLVKVRGADVGDESRSLSDAQVPDGGALIVMRRRRMAVR